MGGEGAELRLGQHRAWWAVGNMLHWEVGTRGLKKRKAKESALNPIELSIK